MSKTKLIIMTTAIIRPILHNDSIKKFYNIHYFPYKSEIDNIFDIYHIINIDQPEKLKVHFTLEQTINNFNVIIPESINKIYLCPENPAFLQAYKNIMHKINELGLLSEDNLYWWFEDDWITNGSVNFFEEIKMLRQFKNSAMTMVKSSPIGSFRGGPIMNGYYFMNLFNIENLGCMNNTCDPEVQVRRYIGATTDIVFPDKKVKRKLLNESDKLINLVMFYVNTPFNKITVEYYTDFYKKKFNNEIKFIYHFIVKNNDELLYLKYENQDATNKNNYKNVTYGDLQNIFDTESIVYLITKPYMFDDCGRDFATKYNLIKGWSKIGDPTTYS